MEESAAAVEATQCLRARRATPATRWRTRQMPVVTSRRVSACRESVCAATAPPYADAGAQRHTPALCPPYYTFLRLSRYTGYAQQRMLTYDKIDGGFAMP